MKSVRFHDNKLKFVKALILCSFDGAEAPAAFYCCMSICEKEEFSSTRKVPLRSLQDFPSLKIATRNFLIVNDRTDIEPSSR